MDIKNFEMFFDSKNDFDRLNFYKDYYKNLSPSDFKITIDENIIKIEISDNKKNKIKK